MNCLIIDPFYSYYIEETTQSPTTTYTKPDIPSFDHSVATGENGYARAKINWRPNVAGHPGSHFYAQYRKEGQPSWERSAEKINEDFDEITALEAGARYEIRVVSVDGSEETPSVSKFIETSDPGKFFNILSISLVANCLNLCFRWRSIDQTS